LSISQKAFAGAAVCADHCHLHLPADDSFVARVVVLQANFEAYIASNALWHRALPRVASCPGTSVSQTTFLLPL
jgi:hypothetical protein